MDYIIKHSYEDFPIRASFGNDLVSGDTVSSKTVTCINRDTGENTKPSIVQGESISSPDVVFEIKGGVDQEVHNITVLVVTSLGNEYRRVIYLHIIDDPAQDSFEKSSDEIAVIAVDFSGELETGDSISATFSVEAASNVDGSDATSSVISSTTASSPFIYCKVRGGNSGVRYNLTVKITTASGYKYARVITMRVRDI